MLEIHLAGTMTYVVDASLEGGTERRVGQPEPPERPDKGPAPRAPSFDPRRHFASACMRAATWVFNAAIIRLAGPHTTAVGRFVTGRHELDFLNDPAAWRPSITRPQT